MATNQKINLKVKHSKPSPSEQQQQPQHPINSAAASSASTSEQLLETLWNAIQTTNDIVGACEYSNNNSANSNANNAQSNGSVDSSLSTTGGARLKADPWRRLGNEQQVIPPPGFFNDDGPTPGWQLAASTAIAEALAEDDVLLPPPEEFDAEAAVQRSLADSSSGNDAGTTEGRELPGKGFLLPPPEVFDNGSQDEDGSHKGDGVQIEDVTNVDVSSEKVTGSGGTDAFSRPVERGQGLADVTVATDCVGLTDITIATESVGRADVTQKLDCLRRTEEKIEGKIIGGLLSVREICALIENNQMCVLQEVMDGESTEKLQRKPVSVSSSTEKLQLKPVSVSSSMEKLEQEPVSISSSIAPKRASPSLGSDAEEVDVKLKEAADAVTMETALEQHGSCGASAEGTVCPSSLKVIAFDASMKLQAAGKSNLQRGADGTLPAFSESSATNTEGNSLATDTKMLSESKEVDAKSIPGISPDGNHASDITTDEPNALSSNHSLSTALGKCRPTLDATTPVDLKINTAADADTLSPDPVKPPRDPDKIPPYTAMLEESKALVSDNSEYPGVSLEPGVRVDLKTSLPATNTGESKSDAGLAGAVQGGAEATAAERNPKPESIVTTHLWSDTAVAKVLNINAGISTDLSNAAFSTNLSQARIKEEKSVAGGEQNADTQQQPGKGGLEGKSSTNNGEKSGRKMASQEKHKMEVIRVDVTESLQQTENERHFISKTVKTTMTQETRSAAVGTPLDVGMATHFGARPKAGSMFAAGSEAKVDVFEDSFTDAKGSKEHTGLLGELKRNKAGKSGLKEVSGVAEKGIGKEPEVRTPGKQNSVFDMLLDQREMKTDTNSWSVFERREASRHQTETSAYNPESSPLNLKSSGFEASVQSSSPTGAASNAGIVDKQDEVSVMKENLPSPTASSSSTMLLGKVTERKEEILRVPRPTSLVVRPGKPPQHSNSQQPSPTTQPTASSANAPLATPEESPDDIPYSNRSRHSSVGPSRSRQSSIGPCRSRQSSIGSLLGYQLVQSSVSTHFVVVAIDFGTTYSGYAFSFTRDPDSIHMMRRWEGGDPGIVNQKTPTTLLLSPDGKFHSFGFAARDSYHDLDPQEAKKWLYFEKFKMTLHHNADLNKDTTIKASNGKAYSALSVFSHALTFFKDHALQELSDQSATTILNEDIRWVITVPAIWKAPAKQFMRQAAYQAGIASPDNPNQLLIALEPEAASIYVRKLRLYQLMPDPLMSQLTKREPTPDPLHRELVSDEEFASVDSVKYKTLPSSVSYRHSLSPSSTTASVGQEVDVEGTNYMVVDCGGGTVDITVYEMESGYGHLKELHKATGGPYGSLGIDLEFEKLLIGIFGSDFIETFRTKRPAGWVDLMIAFESRKRTASPFKSNPLNVSLPFSFIDYYKKYKGGQVENAIRKYGNKEVTWSSQGMLRLTPTAMRRLFQPTLDHIKQAIGDVLNNPNTRDIKYMFLVGGFAESTILQMEMRKEFEHLLRILIPQDVGLTILKGAVCFGLDPTIVTVRRSRMTYGVGVLNRFVQDKHPRSKMIVKDSNQWCTDVFDKFVEVDQSVAVGETVVRSYTPAKAGQKSTIIHVYSSEKVNPQYITDPGVKRCGTLCLDLTDVQYRHSQKPRRREIQARMTFGDTEIKVTALDVATGKCVRAAIDFMNK